MQDSRFETFTIGPFGTNAVPNTVAHAADVPMRVVVKNVGPVPIFLGTASADVAGDTNGPTTNTYQLPVGDTDTFVIAPRQRLYASASAVGGIVCVALSEAIPVEVKR